MADRDVFRRLGGPIHLHVVAELFFNLTEEGCDELGKNTLRLVSVVPVFISTSIFSLSL